MTNFNNKQDVITNIYNLFNNNNYQQTLIALDNYLNNPTNGVYEILLNIYTECQINLGLLDNASKSIELMLKLFPNYYKERQYNLAINYARCLKQDKLLEVVNNNNFNEKQLYLIAKTCYNYTLYETAKKIFTICANSPIDKTIEKAKNYLNLIAIKEKNKDAFLSLSYNYFKYKGYTLSPGHVILVNKINENYKENYQNYDAKKLDRPYMIWKIENDKIYTFPITTRLDKYRYIIPSANYPSRKYDRSLKDTLICINEENITDVIDKITEYDFKKSIDSLYNSVCSTDKGIWPDDLEYFMTTMLKEKQVSTGDVIITNDIKCYYIINITNDKYDTIELDKYYNPINNTMTTLDKDTPIKAIYYLNNSRKIDTILSSISNQEQKVLKRTKTF